MPKRERTHSGLKSWCGMDMKGLDLRTVGLPGRMNIYLMQTIDCYNQKTSAQASCLHGEETDRQHPPHHHLPFLETNWEVTPASNVAKTGLWSLVMMSLVLPAGEGRNFWAGEEGSFWSSQGWPTHSRNQLMRMEATTSLMVSYGCSITFHNHAWKSPWKPVTLSSVAKYTRNSFFFP